ncbi:hypothetical protein GCM10009863_65900 [Streptomyces axinellae]|uniref:Transposase Helix-turn-helix domain-containing protein n=1 Tax=Streptomyces axinellae TaxID=552788 RepID=A0ABN3QZS1_9ACTN
MGTRQRSTCPARPDASSPASSPPTGCRRRPLTPGRQALLALAHLRCDDTCARPAAGFGTGPAAVCRYVHGTLDVLAASLPAAMRLAYVILDGTLPPIDRDAADRPFCSVKHQRQC